MTWTKIFFKIHHRMALQWRVNFMGFSKDLDNHSSYFPLLKVSQTFGSIFSFSTFSLSPPFTTLQNHNREKILLIKPQDLLLFRKFVRRTRGSKRKIVNGQIVIKALILGPLLRGSERRKKSFPQNFAPYCKEI